MRYFIAFGSQDRTHADTIEQAAHDASTPDVQYRVWTREDASGTPVTEAVESWIDDSDGVVADLTYVNENVTYELGYAIGSRKVVRLIRNNSVTTSDLQQIGLLDSLLRDHFRTRSELETLLRERQCPENRWNSPKGNTRQPLYVLAPPDPNSFTTKLFSAIKKCTKYKFRSYKAWEIGRFTAQEAWEQTSSSFGTVVTWSNGSGVDVWRNNQRAAFIFGIARGLGIPCLLLAERNARLPSDLHNQETRWSSLNELDSIFRTFRDEVQDFINDYNEVPDEAQSLLENINCGDPSAENEQEQLKDYFLETEEFKRTLEGVNNLVIGRKGSGKTAIFLQVRDRIRSNKKNIVVDLTPEGYQLIKLKEIILELQSQGTRKEFIAAFWQYVLWLEIAHKILEKDQRASQRDSELAVRYERLEAAFKARVDTGNSDFSERLRILTSTIISRFIDSGAQKNQVLSSSTLLEIVYGKDIATFRDEVMSYLTLKGEILFLFDNLDRMRSPSGFDETDALLILGLIESMQDISKRFRLRNFHFRWVIFIRSDVYEFVVRSMADYSKHAFQSLEWTDPDMLKRVLQTRIRTSLPKCESWETAWSSVSVPMVRGKDVFDFLTTSSLMRPRYVIRLFESAKRRAINMGHQIIQEADYDAALDDIGWTIMEDLNLELRDIVHDADLLLFDIAQLNGACGLRELRDAIAQRVGATNIVEKVIDILLWSGAIGIAPGLDATFIYNCGYKLQFLRSLIDRNPDAEVCLHPTLENLMRSKAALETTRAKACNS